MLRHISAGRAFFVVIVALSLGALPLACSFNVSVGADGRRVTGDPDFGDLVLTTALDPESKAPVGQQRMFASDVNEIFAAINIKNVRAGTEFRFVWRKAGESVFDASVLVSTDMFDNWVYGSLNASGGEFPVGDDYSVELTSNGEPIARANFEIAD